MSRQIYLLEPTDDCEWVMPCDDEGMDRFQEIDGAPLLEAWKPIRVEIVHESEGRKLTPVDIPWFGANVLVMKDSALVALRDVLSGGEQLPLLCEEQALALWTPTTKIDALNESASEVVRFRSSGRVMKIAKHVFNPEALPAAHVFRIPQSKAIYVDHAFVRAVQGAKVSGIDFVEVWKG